MYKCVLIVEVMIAIFPGSLNNIETPYNEWLGEIYFSSCSFVWLIWTALDKSSCIIASANAVILSKHNQSQAGAVEYTDCISAEE